MASLPALTKKETWARVVQSFDSYPDAQHWNQRRLVMVPIIAQAIQAGYDGLFWATTSMHDVLLTTTKFSGARRVPFLVLSMTKDGKLLIQCLPGTYTKGAILTPTIQSHIVEPAEAFQILTKYLQHLWTETVPEPIPEVLRRHDPKEIQ